MKKILLSLFIVSSLTSSVFAISYNRLPSTNSINGNTIYLQISDVQDVVCAYDVNYGYISVEIQGGIQSVFYTFPYEDGETEFKRVIGNLPIDTYYGVYMYQVDGANDPKPTCQGYVEGDGNDLIFDITSGAYSGNISTLTINAEQSVPFPPESVKYMYFALGTNDSLYTVSGTKSAWVTYDIDTQTYFGKTKLNYFNYPTNISNEMGSDGTGPAYQTNNPAHLRTFLCTEATLGDGEECSANGWAYSMANNLGYFDVYTNPINNGYIPISFTPFSPPSPEGCGTGVGLMICNATSSFMATTGFTPAQSVTSVGGMFILPIIGGGLMLIMGLIKWVIVLALISAFVYFSYRAFRFYGIEKRGKSTNKHIKNNHIKK